MYRPSCLIEVFVRPEKYWLVWAELKANHLLNFNFIFLSDGLAVAAYERQVLQIWTTASRSHSAATDGRRNTKLAPGVAWPFGCKTLLVENSSEFKSGKYGGQSATAAN